MNISKNLKMLGLLIIVVAVSAATTVLTGYVTKKQSNNTFAFKGNATPVAFTRYSGVGEKAVNTDFTRAAALSVQAVVHVKVKTPVPMSQMGFPSDPFFEYFFGRPQGNEPQQRQQQPMEEGSGSGVIISSDGYIVTNNHVIDRSKDIEVTLNDNRTFKAKLVGTDPNTDIALLKIDAKNLPVIRFGNSDSLKVGQWVLAVGNPFNLTSTVTAGIVSAKARDINIINSKMPIESFIQTDAAVNPGNSGGALVNTQGELVGINTAIASQTGNYAGYSFAVPVSIVQKVVSDLRKYGIVQRALLGVQIRTITEDDATKLNLKTMEGAYVAKVVPNGAADKAGIKKDDIIIKVDKDNIKSPNQLQEQIGLHSPGDKVKITLLRDNKTKVVTADLKNSHGNFSVVSSESIKSVLGASFRNVTNSEKDKYQIDYGVVVTSVTKGKFQKAGIKPGFIIVKINDQAIRSMDDLNDAFNDAMNSNDKFKAFNIAGIYPDGKIAVYGITLAN